MNKSNQYIIIDDSEIDIFIATKMIELSFPDAKIITFNNAIDAIEMIKKNAFDKPALMFVDINMPIMNGFQFMEEFEKLPVETQKKFVPYFLTSSINDSEIAYAKTFKSIKKYINKPLNSKSFLDI